MDKLDIRICRELLRTDVTPGIRRPIRGVAHRLGVDENTVRSRMEKLNGSGFQKGWLVAVNPNLVSEQGARLWLDVPPKSNKAKAIAEISLLQGVAQISDYFGNSLGVLLFYEDEESLDKTKELISRISNSENTTSARVIFPNCSVTLTSKDWMIIRCLQRNPWKSYTDIAKELALNSATIRRRLARMNVARVLYVVADVNPKAVEGNLLANLAVFYDNPESRQEVNQRIMEHLDDQIAFSDLNDTGHGFFGVMVTNISRIQEILGWVKRQHGLESARLDILQDLTMFSALYESQVKKGLKGITKISSVVNRQIT